MNIDLSNAMNTQGELMGTPMRGTPSRGSRGEMEKFFPQLPDHIKHDLKTGKLRLGDQVVYSIKPIGSSTTIKMFLPQDDKSIGLRNVSNAKLPKGQAMLVSGIYLLVGVAPAALAGSPTEDEIKATVFGSVQGVGAVANGEFSLKANKTTIVPETSNRAFCTDGNGSVNLGYYKLDNPRLISDDVLIEFTVELGTTEDIGQDTYLYVGLDGSITTP